jgi:DNA polymerase III subunit beta
VVHFVAAARPLASALSRADRLLASRTAPICICAAGDRIEIRADDAVCVFGDVTAVVHEPGTVAVGLRALATILSGVAEPDVELRVEGGRLAVRTPSSRFALPTVAVHTTPPPRVPVVGVATGLSAAARVVAGAASLDGLPLFTAVRMTSAGERLTLVATDRFRAAVATVDWQPQSGSPEPVDVLVPAAVLAAAMRFVGHEVPIRAREGWFGADWPGGGIVTAALAVAFPDAQVASLLQADPIATLEVDAAALGAAVERVTPFASNGIVLDIADGIVSVRGDGEMGEAREDVKASTAGDHVTVRYRARYLADAVRAYAGPLGIQVQQGIRPTVFGGGELRYLVVPLRAA